MSGPQEVQTDLSEAADAVGSWSTENFGGQPAHFSLSGIGEELGELTTSILKQAQGIDDAEKYQDRVGDDAEKDAIGDVFIYLMDFSYRADADMDEVRRYLDAESQLTAENMRHGAADAGIEPAEMHALFGIYGTYSELIEQHILDNSRSQIERDIAGIIGMSALLCDLRGFNFDEAVAETMDEVLDREWESDIQV